jgi:hypothetical protein
VLIHINSCLAKHVPSATSKASKDSPWFTHKLRRAVRRKHRLYTKARSTNSDQSWAKYKEAKKHTQNAIKKAHWDYVNNVLIESMEKKESKPFWNYIKSKKQDNIGVAPIKSNGTLFTDAKDKANLINKQFQSVFTKAGSITDTKPDGNPYPHIADLHITVDGVYKLLEDLKVNKASGPDNIPNIMLKELASELAPVLQDLFTQSLSSGLLPSDWRNANITPLFKKGDRHLPVNYRPVSLTSVTCKLLEHIICKHMLHHTDTHGILSDLQHGFRKGRSCETQLLLTVHDLMDSFDKKKQVDIGVLDFSKAFDTVPHNLLLNKLDHYGIRGNILIWIGEFLSNRQQCVIVEGESSSQVHVESGVPQGTVLGPLMFLIFINDLPDQVDSHSQVRLFADDCLLYRNINSVDDHVVLQNDLLSLEQWANRWGMKFNAKKCNILRVSRSKPSTCFYQLCDHILEEVDSCKYLGLSISNDLKWEEHVDTVCNKGNRTLGFLRRNLRYAPRKLKEQAYIAMVRSTLEYSATVWDPCLKKDINKIHRVEKRAARFIANDYRYDSSMSQIFKDLGWSALKDRRREARLALFYKVVNGLVAVDKDEYLQQGDTRTRAKNSMKFKQMKVSTQIFQNSFFPRTIPEWNILPEDTIKCGSVESFRAALRKSD